MEVKMKVQNSVSSVRKRERCFVCGKAIRRGFDYCDSCGECIHSINAFYKANGSEAMFGFKKAEKKFDGQNYIVVPKPIGAIRKIRCLSCNEIREVPIEWEFSYCLKCEQILAKMNISDKEFNNFLLQNTTVILNKNL
jgi:hypothetical protein